MVGHFSTLFPNENRTKVCFVLVITLDFIHSTISVKVGITKGRTVGAISISAWGSFEV